jgi:pimeloyl-ACP methyl ester carboxylesterase
MSETPVLIPVGENVLVGDLAPGGAEAVLLLPGWGGTRYGPQRILLQAAATLVTAGFTTLRIDFRGRGDSPGEPDATLDGMIEDACAAVAWLRAEHRVGRVHLVGLCSGGNVALGAASVLDDIGHVICWSLLPFMEHKTQAQQQGTPRGALLRGLLRKVFSPEAWRKLLRGEANVKGAVKAVVKDKEGDDAERTRKTSRRDILADLRGFTGRVHLLYGTADPEAAGSRAFFTAWCTRARIAADVETIDGAPHNFYTATWTRQVIACTVQWLKP